MHDSILRMTAWCPTFFTFHRVCSDRLRVIHRISYFVLYCFIHSYCAGGSVPRLMSISKLKRSSALAERQSIFTRVMQNLFEELPGQYFISVFALKIQLASDFNLISSSMVVFSVNRRDVQFANEDQSDGATYRVNLVINLSRTTVA
jgi:hypothetical protein